MKQKLKNTQMDDLILSVAAGPTESSSYRRY